VDPEAGDPGPENLDQFVGTVAQALRERTSRRVVVKSIRTPGEIPKVANEIAKLFPPPWLAWAARVRGAPKPLVLVGCSGLDASAVISDDLEPEPNDFDRVREAFIEGGLPREKFAFFPTSSELEKDWAPRALAEKSAARRVAEVLDHLDVAAFGGLPCADVLGTRLFQLSFILQHHGVPAQGSDGLVQLYNALAAMSRGTGEQGHPQPGGLTAAAGRLQTVPGRSRTALRIPGSGLEGPGKPRENSRGRSWAARAGKARGR
jgi:hypothetical protein